MIAAVKRNSDRFPNNFRFQLSVEEKEQLVTICDWFDSPLMHSMVNRYAFSEHKYDFFLVLFTSISTSLQL